MEECSRSPKALSNNLEKNGCAILPFARRQSNAPHRQRRCVYDEAVACIELGKDDPELIVRHVEAYRALGYPARNGLAELSVIVRRHTPRATRFFEAWWEEIRCGSRRDGGGRDGARRDCWRRDGRGSFRRLRWRIGTAGPACSRPCSSASSARCRSCTGPRSSAASASRRRRSRERKGDVRCRCIL